MNRDQQREILKSKLKDYVESITQKSRGANLYVCPLCGSGTGQHGTGAFSIKGNSWKCFSCNESGDIFDLIGKVEGIQDYTDQLRRAGEIFGINADSTQSTPKKSAPIDIKSEQCKDAKPEEKELEVDYTAFFLQANKDLDKTDYHRGISLETLNRFQIGFVKEWKHPNNPKIYTTTPRLIIPTSKTTYVARHAKENLTEDENRYYNVGISHLFNIPALWNTEKPIFIVEGALDALSVIDVGGEAVGLNSTSGTGILLKILKTRKPTQPLIIAQDNDQGGAKATDKLKEGLKELNIQFYIGNPQRGYKDPNDALNANREEFKQAVEAIEADIRGAQQEVEEAEREEYLKNSTENYIQDFLNGIARSADTPCIPTGFMKLDAELDGGLYEGLYIVGAISSLGKTTLILQIADQIAQSGRDVLIFSLEMARSELMSKSISRHTMHIVLETGGDIKDAKTARGITAGDRYKNYSETENNLIRDAITEYSHYAKHIFISEGIGDIGVNQIRETVEKHIRFTGVAPVVVVDYLQILAPYNERYSDKQNTDKAVLELKRLSRDYKLPIIAISSLNRQSYKEEIAMDAYKESGGIEYSSDVLFGLQLKGAGDKKFNANEAKKKNPREIELIILKNRNGKTGEKIDLAYYPIFNYFEEV